MEKYIEYAPYIIIVIGFLIQYKIFVTPEQMREELEKKLDKYVLKETNDITINQLKDDMAEIKEKIDKIYDKIMNV